MATCSQEGCEGQVNSRGLCRNHYMQLRRREVGGEIEPRPCEGCGKMFTPKRRWAADDPYQRGRFHSRGCKEDAYVADGRQAIAMRKSYFKTRYGLTVAQVEEMEQAGCAICGRTDWNGRHGRPHVDHDHVTGRVRGMLCHSCNVGIGSLGEDPARLRAAAAYLER